MKTNFMALVAGLNSDASDASLESNENESEVLLTLLPRPATAVARG